MFLAVYVQLGPRLVQRLQQRNGGGTARPQRRGRAPVEGKEEEYAGFGFLTVPLPPPLSDEELNGLGFAAPPLPSLLFDEEPIADDYDASHQQQHQRQHDDQQHQQQQHLHGEQHEVEHATLAPMAMQRHRDGDAAQADREFVQNEVAAARLHFRAEQERRAPSRSSSSTGFEAFLTP